MVEDDQVRVACPRALADLFDFPRADERRGLGPLPRLEDAVEDRSACAFGQGSQLLKRFLRGVVSVAGGVGVAARPAFQIEAY